MPAATGGRNVTFGAAASDAPVVAPGTGGQLGLADVQAQLHVSVQLSPAVMQTLRYLAGISFCWQMGSSEPSGSVGPGCPGVCHNCSDGE